MPGDTRLIAVVGAGAAGTMAAIHAAGPGCRVVLLESTSDGGRKILISGGGRCNILPGTLDERRFVTDSSPNTLKKLLRAWPLGEQRRFFEERLDIPLALEAESGKLFPVSNRARDVRDGLLSAARQAGVELRFESAVTTVRSLSPAGWEIGIRGQHSITADALILATGGLSVPTTGSDGLGLRLAASLGHVVHPTYPALTPLVAEPPVHGDLSGVSLHVAISAGGRRSSKSEGGFLFTHRGYSGPSVLDISHVPVRARMEGEAAPVLVRWGALDAEGWAEVLEARGGGTVLAALRQHLPARLAERLTTEAGIDLLQTVAQLRRGDREALLRRLTRYELPWTNDEGYRKAEVTGGGVALDQVDPRTLESRRCPGLFLCGELLDAFGPIGGYNFAWAWATGRAAGLGACGWT
ncbi:MAG: NAD(P)/FAD-dependent oxidoreductase, partial [Gemmatimonadales bacterium]